MSNLGKLIRQLRTEKEMTQKNNLKRLYQMIIKYIEAALTKAKYEIIRENEEKYYGEIPELQGVWATGNTMEECRENLKEVVEGWIIVKLKKGISIPPVAEHQVDCFMELEHSG